MKIIYGFFLLGVGCFDPTISDGSIACELAATADCPPGFECGADGFCYRDPSGEVGGEGPDDAGLAGSVAWATASHGRNFDDIHAVAAAGDSVVVAGSFSSDDFEFGGRGASGNSSPQAFIASLSSGSGDIDRLKSFGGAFDDQVRAVVLDSEGNRIVAGQFGSTVAFGQGIERSSLGSHDAFVAKFDRDGRAIWVTALAGSGNFDSALALAVDRESGRIYAVGEFSGDLLVGEQPLLAAGDLNGFLVAIEPGGEPLWARALKSPGRARALSVAAHDGQVVVSGEFEQSLSPAGTESTVFEVSADSGLDAFAAAFDADGDLHWARAFGGTGQDVGTSIAIRQEVVLLAGSASPDTSFAPLTHAAFTNAFGDGFVVELDGGTGVPRALLDLRADGGSSLVHGLAVSVDGSIAVVGEVSGESDLVPPGSAAAGTEAFVALHSASITEAPVWVRGFGGVGRDMAAAAAFDEDGGRVVVAGHFETSIEFDTRAFSSGGAVDTFAVSLWR